ncbi:MAG: UDP-N-acetylmuramate dehydrogenase [Dysgonamonadaceae bacterium]|jgi:UDP-N-acetylmuramate dehydrogenase|nr:UDP-N-acetylmuramate dehydrogenase [Dysgonamonadaceae bacterium]
MRIKQNYSLKKHNTFGLDVRTKYFLEYENEADLYTLMRDEYFFSEQFMHIGQGSNLLFLGDYNGIIVHSAIVGAEILSEDEDSVLLSVGSGHDWDSLVSLCVENGWGGLENLSLIPGEAGAAAVQNIGAYGAEAADCIEEVHTFYLVEGEKRIFKKSECGYGYRTSFFKQEDNRGKYFVSRVVFRLSKKPEFNIDYGDVRKRLENKEITLKNVRNAVIEIRREKLPNVSEIGSAGSFFMNPYICKEHYEGLKKHYPDIKHYPVNEEVVKIPAAWLIEKCGLKGKTLGGAQIYERQPLVIVNRGNAAGSDIAALAEEVQAAVKEKFFIDLKPEVNYV